jgi:hypothetical protein
MRTTRIIWAALIVGSGLALHLAQAQNPEIARTGLKNCLEVHRIFCGPRHK